jgi:ABC-type lipoprotein release transport system permease subunit
VLSPTHRFSYLIKHRDKLTCFLFLMLNILISVWWLVFGRYLVSGFAREFLLRSGSYGFPHVVQTTALAVTSDQDNVGPYC